MEEKDFEIEDENEDELAEYGFHYSCYDVVDDVISVGEENRIQAEIARFLKEEAAKEAARENEMLAKMSDAEKEAYYESKRELKRKRELERQVASDGW
jgi:hypothetical protein